MSELYRHLLVPEESTFGPGLDQVARFFERLKILEALPKETKFKTVTHTGKTRAIARNANTGEVYYGPELKIDWFRELSPAIDSIRGAQIFSLSAEGIGPTTIPPFDLYSADDYRSKDPGALWQKPYTFSVRCRQSQGITHLLHSGFGCKCELKPDEPAVFENPWNNTPIQSSALGCATFWVEIGIGDYLMPLVTDTLEILDTRLVNTAKDAFGVGFGQGCIRNDD